MSTLALVFKRLYSKGEITKEDVAERVNREDHKG